MAKISSNIRKYRNEAGLTQEALAEKISVTRQTVSGWENGRTQPDIDMLEALSSVLGASVEEMIYGKKNRVGFEPVEKENRNVFVIVLTILGSLLTAAGVVLVFVSCWHKIPQGVKGILAFFPLAVGFMLSLYSNTKKSGNDTFNEGTAVIWTVGFIVTNALLSALYYPDFEANELALIDCLGIIPIMFITKAVFPFTAFVSMLTGSVISLQADSLLSTNVLLSGVFVALTSVAVIFLLKFDKKDFRLSLLRQLLSVGILVGVIGSVINVCECMKNSGSQIFPTMAVLISTGLTLLLIDRRFENIKLVYHGTIMVAVPVITIAFFSVADSNNNADFSASIGKIAFTLIVSAVIILCGLIIGRKNLFSGAGELVNFAVSLSLLAVSATVREDFGKIPFVFIIITLLMGGIYLTMGIKSGRMFFFNVGLIMICSIAAIFAIGSEIEVVYKGIIMAVIGTVILFVNRMFMKKTVVEKEGTDNA